MKSILIFKKWTKKMSKFAKPKYFIEKAFLLTIIEN